MVKYRKNVNNLKVSLLGKYVSQRRDYGNSNNSFAQVSIRLMYKYDLKSLVTTYLTSIIYILI